ncbi:MAG TPA: response regulator, partial [Candidatus Latescibacteria bacterium]|nr:response regulator [Candidatus Latescibacterota bacterium]
MEAVGNLAGGVAHDFNNLLTVISGNTELLLDTGIGEQPRELAYEIIQASDRAGSLTRQLLAFSRREVVQPRVFDLNSLVSKLEQMLRRLIGEHIQLDVELTDELSFVEADPGLIEQVIVNLSVNARDAMTSGGRLLIQIGRTQLEADDPSWEREFPPGRYVTLALSDNGSGMAPEVQARIFEPFFTTKEREQGTGLGLATVYGIVQQAGGLIRLTSELGHGTTFTVFLPLREAEPEAATQFYGESLAQSGGNETILLVEDEASILDVLSSNLEASGYKVLRALNGADAMALIQGHQGELDLLVSDVVMPVMSGPELYAQLRVSHPHIKVIFISGYSNWPGRSGTLLPKGVPYLQKP